MTTRVMCDIETLGIEPRAAILSIGACTFDREGVGEDGYDTAYRCRDCLVFDLGHAQQTHS